MAKILAFENEEFKVLRAKLIAVTLEDFKYTKGFNYSSTYLMALDKLNIKVADIIKANANK